MQNQKTFQLLEFDQIIEKLKEYSYTQKAKEQFEQLIPYLSEIELRIKMRETTEARIILDKIGTPPLISMKQIDKILAIAEKGGMLSAEELELIAVTLKSMKRLKNFLDHAKSLSVGIAYLADEIIDLEETRIEIERCIRNGQIDDYASSDLKEIRRSIAITEEKLKNKAESLLQANKKWCNEDFVAYKSGRICLPVKKSAKNKIQGSVIDQSRSGDTLFIEPTMLTKLSEELDQLKTIEENEEIRILYTLTTQLSDGFEIFMKNKKIVEELDFIFAKGKLSLSLQAIEPYLNTNQSIYLKQAKHPLLPKEKCIPLDFRLGNGLQGMIITGPNTGGKTVCLKTVGIISLMAGCGLHVPCQEADISMHNQILCDIGDGQDLAQNLSTFSAHLSHVMNILKQTTQETLVLLDELGSGTDPTEGMGIAIAILEELRNKRCLFLATTHYPEVKVYAEEAEEITNARMAFDRQSLKPLYMLEIGKSGESQALYLAKQLGMPQCMMLKAYQQSYPQQKIDPELIQGTKEKIQEIAVPKIIKQPIQKEKSQVANYFKRGDSVIILPEKKIAIVCQEANDKGEILVQRKKEKFLVNHKRLKLKIPASQLYPPDYDFSIIFDRVEDRKKRHMMERKHCEGNEINLP
jgi:dsDNA-specific endonuclease/ATPase MutS2